MIFPLRLIVFIGVLCAIFSAFYPPKLDNIQSIQYHTFSYKLSLTISSLMIGSNNQNTIEKVSVPLQKGLFDEVRTAKKCTQHYCIVS